MKNKIFINIFCFIIGALIFGSISAYAAIQLSGANVVYNETTVQDALDNLYDKAIYGDAIEGDILAGKNALINGSKISGTMTNNGAWTSTPTMSGKVTIPAGYHNGLGYVDTSNITGGKNTTAVLSSPTINLEANSSYVIYVYIYHYNGSDGDWVPTSGISTTANYKKLYTLGEQHCTAHQYDKFDVYLVNTTEATTASISINYYTGGGLYKYRIITAQIK